MHTNYKLKTNYQKNCQWTSNPITRPKMVFKGKHKIYKNYERLLKANTLKTSLA